VGGESELGQSTSWQLARGKGNKGVLVSTHGKSVPDNSFELEEQLPEGGFDKLASYLRKKLNNASIIFELGH
jgi:hypothetical protein